jgi:hypothetical protein
MGAPDRTGAKRIAYLPGCGVLDAAQEELELSFSVDSRHLCDLLLCECVCWLRNEGRQSDCRCRRKREVIAGEGKGRE